MIGLQKSHGVHVAPELNRQIRNQFKAYIDNFIDCQSILTKNDDSMLVNFGTYMDNYEE